MARTELTVQQMPKGGLQASYTALIADGHMYDNEGRKTFIHVKNGVTAFTLTIQTGGVSGDGNAIADQTVSIGSNEEHFIPPRPAAEYNQASDGRVWLDYSDQTDGTLAILTF